MATKKELLEQAGEITKGMKVTADGLGVSVDRIRGSVNESASTLKRVTLNFFSAASSAPGFGAPQKFLNSMQIDTIQAAARESKRELENIERDISELNEIYEKVDEMK